MLLLVTHSWAAEGLGQPQHTLNESFVDFWRSGVGLGMARLQADRKQKPWVVVKITTLWRSTSKVEKQITQTF